MGKETFFAKEKLIVGVLISREDLRGPLEDDLKREWGAFDYTAGPLSFDYTHYYDGEMERPYSAGSTPLEI